MTHHEGNLNVTERNLDYAKTVTSIGGWCYIKAEADLSALESIGGECNIQAEADMSALYATGFWDVGRHIYFSDPPATMWHQGRDIRLENIDGLTMAVGTWKSGDGIEVAKARYFGGGDFDKLKRCYIARSGDITAHGNTLAQAIDDLRYKMNERAGCDAVIAEVRATGRITRAQYRIITGACRDGVDEFLAGRGIPADQEDMPLDECLALTKDAYGGKEMQRIFAEGEQQ